MKKIIVSLIVSALFVGISFASNTSSRCKTLLEQTKGTAKQQIAEQTCGVTPTVTKKVARKIIGKIPHRSDTSISTGDVKKILADSIIIGNPKARYLIIEYSDLQCPFCQRHWKDQTLNSVVDKYKGKVAKTFRNFPLEFHQHADSGAFAALCVAMQDKGKYYEFIGGVFEKGLSSESVIYEVAGNIKIDVKTLKECISSNLAKERTARQILEAMNLFGVTGTPGHVILDTINGKYKLIIGAYPASEFEGFFDRILK
ncbi:MAG: DsbA family protein [Candidatus Absconditabacterales bacterium]